MSYIAYHFTVSPPEPGSEILMALIAEMGFESFEMNESGFTAFILENETPNVDLENLKFEDFNFSYTIVKIARTNWNEEWEKNFQPVRINDLVLIRAPFHESDKKVKHEVIIMPKMSFGTGHHQTTQLMCMGMLDADLKGKRVLDMGCGTGVLAILAKKLGAADVLAIDIDEWSVENCIENCATNDCSDVLVKQGNLYLLEEEKEFDVILANINKNILKGHLKTYSDKLKKGGKLFISGFFKTDVEELTSIAALHHLKSIRISTNAEWAMIEFEKA